MSSQLLFQETNCVWLILNIRPLPESVSLEDHSREACTSSQEMPACPEPVLLAEHIRQHQPTKASKFKYVQPESQPHSTIKFQLDSPEDLWSPINLHQSMVAILTFFLSFQLTGVCSKALLDLIYLHLPKTANIFKISLQAFKNYFEYLQGPKVFKYYFSICYSELPPQTKCHTCKTSNICYLVKLNYL
ncbi:Serine--tRNA ligase [Frankliniella fusca]|uniref:Serine--tRNA ligase n=1 Tax=Frankliniella fusca TaxID=407009 RepID=A0AAE1HGK0_9NEOP|nr:Serine--tRNA ligase [Frankliniella fusca]